MYGKVFFFLVLVILGAVLPYLLADDQWLADAETWFAKTRTKLAGDAAADAAISEESFARAPLKSKATTIAPGPTTMYGTMPAGLLRDEFGVAPVTTPQPEPEPRVGRNLDLPRVLGPPWLPLENLLSFHVTPEWISGNWRRVTTQLAELDLQGWRVPIGLGSGPQTLAGSTTYFFDAHRQLQRICLHGYSADPSELIKLATGRFQMRRVPSPLDDFYTATADGQTVGALRIRFAPVAKSSSAKRCEVLMELNRHGSSYGMSQEFSRLLQKTSEDLRLLDPNSLNGRPAA